MLTDKHADKNSNKRLPLEKIIQNPPTEPATACVIWLHGLGSNGYDFAPIVPDLGLPVGHTIRFIFPHAPHQAVTLNQGMHMPAWYDITGLTAHSPEDQAGIEASYFKILDLIEEQYQQGIPYHNIFLIGFSKGGALSLYTGLRFEHQLGGVAALSSYLPLQYSIKKARLEQALHHTSEWSNSSLPLFVAHGVYDKVVSFALAQKTLDCLHALGFVVDFRTYPILHTVNAQELKDIGQWLCDHMAVS